jgi:hypothetical protein
VSALKQVWEIDPSEIDIGTEVIGSGNYGTVYKAHFHEIEVAVKKIHTKRESGLEMSSQIADTKSDLVSNCIYCFNSFVIFISIS